MKALLLSLILILSGCEMLAMKAGEALVGAGKNGIEADAELTIGQKKEDNDVETHIGDNQKAQTITNNKSGPNGFVILLIVLLAGWAIPAPSRMFAGIKNFFKSS